MKRASLFFVFLGGLSVWLPMAPHAEAEPIHVTYLWHMHQPIYVPYLSVNDIDNGGWFGFSVAGVHNERQPNYTSWPENAVEQGTDLQSAGAQCSFSGSLIENLNGLWGSSTTETWDNDYDYARNTLRTSPLDNPRLDMVAFAYHHSLMPLTCPESRRMQIRLHKEIYSETFDTGGGYSKGMFPPETAFAEWMIPDLVAEGIDWVLVDNIHFDRACQNYPWNSGGSVYRPNPADQVNPDPGTWVQLNNVWAPTLVSAPFGYQPHIVQHVDPWSDPASPSVSQMVAVPAARYEGNENGRGGYGAFKPENVWGTMNHLNNDPNHPMLMVCHSDGDNFGMKNSSAWNTEHGNFLDMCRSNADFDNTTVQDYLERYPVAAGDLIHVEPGSWAGADAGDPEFKKWLADPPANPGDPNPDRFSWSVLVAAQNLVIHADDLENSYSMNDVRWGIGSDTAKAWHFYLNAEASDYWYWDTDWSNPWNGNVTRGCNLSINESQKVISRHPGTDNVAPSIFPPQREPYNPGGFEWNETSPQPSDFEVLTYVYDASGLQSVTLYWRTDKDGFNPLNSIQNELYADGMEVNAWSTQAMSGAWIPSNKGPGNIVPDPLARAMTYTSTIAGQSEVLIDYFVEAIDSSGNVRRSDISHVYVGLAAGGGSSAVTFTPSAPQDCDPLAIDYDPTGGPLESATAVDMFITFDDWATWQTNSMSLQGGDWTVSVGIPQGATGTSLNFRDPSGLPIDDNEGANWSVTIGACARPSTVSFNPSSPDGCVPVVVTYDPGTGPLASVSPVYIHKGRNGWDDVSDVVMSDNGDGTWDFTNETAAGTFEINCVFTDLAGTWDNNQGQDWAVTIVNCAGGGGTTGTVTGCIGLAYGSPGIADDPPSDQNVAGENFDLNPAGGFVTEVEQGGFGDFGQLYMNYDETNLYIGATDADPAGNNNGMMVFLGVNTRAEDATNLIGATGKPLGLDLTHNLLFDSPMDLAILLGDEYGDTTLDTAQLASGTEYGQGIFYLTAGSFTPLVNARISQFDGSGTTPTSSGDDDGNRIMDRWEVSIPWSSLGANSVTNLTEITLAALLFGGTSGNDRYISGDYVAALATSPTGLDGNDNFAFGQVTVTPLTICMEGADTDNDQMPDVWETIQGFDPEDPDDGAEDADGDGFRNRNEHGAGTNPHDPGSYLKITDLELVPTQGWRLYWPSVLGKVYNVWRSTNLLAGYELVIDAIGAAPGTNDHLDTTAPINADTVHYLIEVEDDPAAP